jgi:Tol biopolymer transport system component
VTSLTRSFFLTCTAICAARAQNPAAPLTPLTIGPVTAAIDEYSATADGKRVYYSTTKGEVWLYDRVRNTSARIADGGEIWDIAAAPNGSSVAFTRAGENKRDQFVWIVPLDPKTGLATGPQRRVSALSGDVPAVSPDGRSIAFARDDSSTAQTIVVAPVAGGPERAITPAAPGGIYTIRWSPDGKTLVFTRKPSRDGTAREHEIESIQLAGGTPKVIAATTSGFPGLSPDGSVIAFRDTGLTNRFVITDPTGQRLATYSPPRGGNIDGWLSGSTAIVSNGGYTWRLHALSIADGSSRIVMDTLPGPIAPAWSPDGKRIAVGVGNGLRYGLAVMNADGGSPRVLPLDASVGPPMKWSPDGRWVLYNNPGQHTGVFAVDLASGAQVDLADSRTNLSALWLADSRRLLVGRADSAPRPASPHITFYEEDLHGGKQLVRDLAFSSGRHFAIALDEHFLIVSRGPDEPVMLEPIAGGGQPRQLLSAPRGFVAGPIVSEDRKWVAFRRNVESDDNSKLTVVDVVNVAAPDRPLTIKLPFAAASGDHLAFLPGNKQLVISENARANSTPALYLVTIAKGEVKKLVTLKRVSARAPDFAVSPDGNTVLYTNRDSVPSSSATLDVTRLIKRNP